MKKLLTVVACLMEGILTAQNASAQTNAGETQMGGKKILVAYYSYSGNTKEVAQAIHDLVGGDIFEIKADVTYPDAYRSMTEQAKREIQSKFRPVLTTQTADMAQYDVVFLGTPTWWGTIPTQIDSFLEAYDLSGKTVVPFVTHGGGGKQNTVADMTAQCKGCVVEQNAWVGYGNRTSGLKDWLKEIKI